MAHGGAASRAEAAPGPEAELAHAVAALRAGGVVAHASEGVWGLACDPFAHPAVAKIHAIKGRAVAKGLIVVAGDAAVFAPELDPLEAALAERIRASWPGAVTWVVANRRFPAWITGGRDTTAIRVPAHAQARALATAFGGLLVSTSANRTGDSPATTAEEVLATLGGEIDYLLPGTTSGRQGPSRIVDAATGKALR